MTHDSVNKAVVLLMTLGITALFLAMIQQFLMALFLAGLFSALARPLFVALRKRLGGRAQLASALTLLIVVVTGLIPLVLLITILVAQALDVSQTLGLWIRDVLAEPGAIDAYLAQLPFYDRLMVYQDELIAQGTKVAATMSGLLVEWVSGATLGTAHFLFMSLVVLYSMYFLQMDGPRLIERMLYYLPLKTSDERIMLEKFTSVTRALSTVQKNTLPLKGEPSASHRAQRVAAHR